MIKKNFFKKAIWVSKNAELKKLQPTHAKKVIREKVTENGVFYFYYCVQMLSAYILILESHFKSISGMGGSILSKKSKSLYPNGTTSVANYIEKKQN
jgi:hypothetical protein